MEIGEAVGRYEQAAALLPSRWQQAARRVPEHRKAQAEEFRLRAGRPMTLLTCEGELLVSDELPRQSVTQADLEQLCDAVTGYSRYAAAETMGKGYLIGRGGFRIGLCGTVAVRGDGGTALRDISSAVVRISRQVRGLWQEVPEWSAGGFDSTLIAAPPGGGKTTLLRDMIATLSNGTEDRCPLRVGVVDERGELAGMYRGVPQLDVGCHTDVLDGCPKALGIPMLLRSANPQVIAVDEITVREDIAAMAGDRFFSIHPRRGTNSILDKKAGAYMHAIASIKEVTRNTMHSKGGGILHTVDDNLLVGPDAVETWEKENTETHRESIDTVFRKQTRTMQKLSRGDIITYFTGVRAPTFEEDFIIEMGRKTGNILHCAGIQSPGLTTAPVVALDIEKMAVEYLSRSRQVTPNEQYDPIRPAPPVLREMSDEERAAFIRQNPDYGVIVCRCEEISRGEILDALRSPICVPTVDGVKKRVRPGMGRCQGGFCSPLVTQMIAEFLGVPPEEVRKSSEEAVITYGKTK